MADPVSLGIGLLGSVVSGIMGMANKGDPPPAAPTAPPTPPPVQSPAPPLNSLGTKQSFLSSAATLPPTQASVGGQKSLLGQ